MKPKHRQNRGRIMFSNTVITLSVLTLLVLIVICWLSIAK